jgi:hypothetical protein
VVADGVAVVLDAQPEMVRATAATAPTTANERSERFMVFSPSVWLCFIASSPVIWIALHDALLVFVRLARAFSQTLLQSLQTLGDLSKFIA